MEGAALRSSEDKRQELVAVTVTEFMAMDLPKRELILDPWLHTQGLAMIYAARGVGKTHASLGIAHAVASGGQFLRWSAPAAREVLFIDGEMPAVLLRERLALLAGEMEGDLPLRILSPDLQARGIPDLGTWKGREAIDRLVTDQTRLIILDNLSTLVRSGKENEAESWEGMQAWLLRHRAQGRAVILIHHAGKGGDQRGTSRREDILDTVLALKRPSGYSPQQGALFEVHVEKARGLHGEAVAPFQARLATRPDDTQEWVTEALSESDYERVVALANEGASCTEIARETGINKGTVSRHMKRAREQGRLGPDEGQADLAPDGAE